jgi:lysophospholipase L1-like esterase
MGHFSGGEMSRAKVLLGAVSKHAAAVLALIVLDLLCVAVPAFAQTWVPTWTASPQASPGMRATYSNQTLRQVVHVSIGGNRVVIRLSNEFGTHPVLIGGATVALAGPSGSSTLHPLTFGGAKSITVRSGAPVLSDPVELRVPPLSDLSVSIYLPGVTEIETVHQTGLQTGYVSAAGDFTERADFTPTQMFNNRVLLAGVLVETDAHARAIVAFGDSITDGFRSTANANNRWPDVLARRLQQTGAPIAVLNEGITANRLLTDGIGISGLARFERDVLSQPGLSHVIVLLGINDLGLPGTSFDPSGTAPAAEEIISGYKQLIERAHMHGVKIIGATLMPFEHALEGPPNGAYFSSEKNAKRQVVNTWIRTSNAFDGVIDFERVIVDPSRPAAVAPQYDSGDHLHPNDAGYTAMGEAIDLKILQ